MEYILLLIPAIALMIASSQSGMLSVNATSAKDIREQLQGIDKDQVLSAFESLKSGGTNNQWLQGIDEDQILSAFESLQLGLNQAEDFVYFTMDNLPVIIGAVFGTADGTGGEGDRELDRTGGEIDQELPAEVQSGGNIPLMTMEPTEMQ